MIPGKGALSNDLEFQRGEEEVVSGRRLAHVLIVTLLTVLVVIVLVGVTPRLLAHLHSNQGLPPAATNPAPAGPALGVRPQSATTGSTLSTTRVVSTPSQLPSTFVMPSWLTLTQAVAVGSGPNIQLAYTFSGMTVSQATSAISAMLISRGWQITEVATAMDSIIDSLSGFGWIGSISISGAVGPEVNVNLNPVGGL